MAESIAEQLACPVYHGSKHATEREELLAVWARGEGDRRWIVATSGLGTGIDIKGIVYVIHAGQPWGLVDFIQQTGRGGRRQDEMVRSVVITRAGQQWRDIHEDEVGELNRQAMERFLQTTGCRRVEVGVFMDGMGQECDQIGARRCDQCQNRPSSEAIGAGRGGGDDDSAEAGQLSRIQRHRQQRQEEESQLTAWLEEVEGCCSVCFATWCVSGRREKHRSRHEHAIGECVSFSTEQYLQWRRQVRFKEGICCWICGLPERMCEKVEGDTGRICRWLDAVLPVVMQGLSSARRRDWMFSQLNADKSWAAEEKYQEWLGRTTIRRGERISNCVAVWARIVQQGRVRRG